jgi:hypothetical protein
VESKPNRLVLKGVPKIKFYDGGPRCPEDIPFPSVMHALMEYFNEDDFGCRSCRATKPACRIPCTYAFFIGVSGVASFLNWKPGWEMDNVEIMYMSDDPAAPFERAFRAAGYEYKVHGPGGDPGDSKSAIIESIRKERPVIAFGPIGPPEAGLITGYDEGGDVLVGWNFFQSFPDFNSGVEFEPTGEFRKRNWIDYPPGFTFITVGGKKERPPLKETFRSALEWMVRVARTPVTFKDRRNGLAAFDAWAEQVQRNEDFPKDDRVLYQRHDVHNNVTGFLAEARWYGSQFLIGMTAGGDDVVHRDIVEDLYHAAGLYAGEHGLMWKLWDLVGGNGNPNAWKKLADPAVRLRIAPVILQARDKDAAAVDHLERALENWH